MGVVAASDAPHEGKELIRLICQEKKELFVPRSLLIQSSAYFAAILSEESRWEESSERTIELDAWPRDDLAVILRSLETKDLEPVFENANHYFPSIHYFFITPLLDPCIDFLLRNISDGSVIDDFELAERFSIVELRDECMKYLLRRLPKILRNSQESRRKMTAELLQKLLRHEKLVVRNEDEVLSMIDIWCSSGQRKSERAKLLHEVRFVHLTKNVFDRCSQDAQCLEVPLFRRLLETPRWSDLDEDVLSGRNSNEVHHHIVAVLGPGKNKCELTKLGKYDELATGVVIQCSESGSMSPARDAISEVYARSMIDHKSSVTYGKGLFVLQRPMDVYCGSHQIGWFSGFQHFSDFRDSKPSLTIQFPKPLCVVAPPVAFENDLFVVHMLYEDVCQPTYISFGRHTVKPEIFEGLEIRQYRNGEATSRRLEIPTKYDSRSSSRGRITTWNNKLFVNDKWTILSLLSKGIMVVIDSPHPVGPIIEIPKKSCEMITNITGQMLMSDCSTDLVIVGNVAYLLINFSVYSVYDEFAHPMNYLGCDEMPAGNLTAYDLTEGKWLPDHSMNLKTERSRFGCFYGEFIHFYLKVVQNEVFLIVIGRGVDAGISGSPLVNFNYVYRLERSADGLCLTRASASAAANVGLINRGPRNAVKWEACPLNVDAHPCEYATALQCKASREEDPIKREKLRRFIW